MLHGQPRRYTHNEVATLVYCYTHKEVAAYTTQLLPIRRLLNSPSNPNASTAGGPVPPELSRPQHDMASILSSGRRT